ncbi:MAG: hypothetical protein IE909_11010 [Campylobacterales bacterium]|nr:hypothetical protein [Campylobacterales bacterium]
MRKMLYTFGHKIPDSDSIIGAISMAYLQEKLGHETKAVLFVDRIESLVEQKYLFFLIF